ncbi:MAG: prephenate dehydrogenase/arogenate dehydrogenase family protein [Candidatus Saccharibacteria bacterium]
MSGVKVSIIGLGLIGGSLGLALCHSNLDLVVAGHDLDPQVMDLAVDMGCVHEVGTVEQIVDQADYVFICTPIKHIGEIVAQIGAHCKPGCIVTDVGSTKQGIVKLFKELPSGVIGIPGHPMAGSEQQGIKGADRYLFENAVYVLTPEKGCPPEAVASLEKLVKLTGAHVIIMDPEKHDRVVATVSHLPHLVASALVSMLDGEEDATALAASGFRDTTRIAGGDPELWTDILMTNRQLMIDRIEVFKSRLDNLQELLQVGNHQELHDFLSLARDIRGTLPKKRKGLVPDIQDVICIVPDQPGIIGLLGTWLGEQGVNIADIEILRVREGDGGTIRLGVASEAESVKAVDVLKEHGVKAWLR